MKPWKNKNGMKIEIGTWYLQSLIFLCDLNIGLDFLILPLMFFGLRYLGAVAQCL